MRRALAALALVGVCACTDARTNEIVLDWTYIGGEHKRLDRVLISRDGQARRNKRGNLATRAAITDEERRELEQLRREHAALELDHHADGWAFRLRFAGHGSDEDPGAVRGFAERVLERLAPGAVLRRASIVVAAVVEERAENATSRLRIERVLKDVHASGLEPGARIAVTLPDGREGAGGALTVFALSGNVLTATAQATYVKMSVPKATQLVHP